MGKNKPSREKLKKEAGDILPKIPCQSIFFILSAIIRNQNKCVKPFQTLHIHSALHSVEETALVRLSLSTQSCSYPSGASADTSSMPWIPC